MKFKTHFSPGPWTVESSPLQTGMPTTPIAYLISGHTEETINRDTLMANEMVIERIPDLIQACLSVIDDLPKEKADKLVAELKKCGLTEEIENPTTWPETVSP